MNLVFVCFYEAYPPSSGAASVTWNVAKHGQGSKVLIQLGKIGRPGQKVDGVTIITLKGASDSKWKKISGLYSRIQRITDTICKTNPDVVVLEGASWVLYHLMLLHMIRRRQPQAAIVYHSHNVEYFLRKEKHGRLVTGLTRWAERHVLQRADAQSAVSEVDIRLFEELYGVKPELLPNGVDTEVFDNVTEDEVQVAKSQYGLNNKTILFTGSYLYRPNREAIDFLIKKVMPRVIQKCSSANLAIIGGDVPYSEQWLISAGIIPHEQLPAFIKACDVGVAPIFSGSGTRLKILEYMAAGIPVVATSKGAEGLVVESGHDLLISDDEKDFVSNIVKLLRDRNIASSLAKSGKKLVSGRYSWKTIMDSFNCTLSSIDGGTTH